MTSEQTQLVESQIPYARTLARRMYHRLRGRIEREDLEGVAYLALVSCIGSFDAARGTLTTYVFRRVNGAMLDFVRAEDPLSRDQRKAAGDLQVKQQFADEDEESGIKISQLPAQTESPERAAIVGQAFDALCRYETDARNRRVMVLSYCDLRSQYEIAAKVGVSSARISQIMHRETHKLRVHMGVA
jgi:RNA polymerase sigma factor (sigma-70 family)